MEFVAVIAWFNEQLPFIWFPVSVFVTHAVDFLKTFSGKGQYRGDAQYSLVGLGCTETPRD
jgi:hypothetical protein